MSSIFTKIIEREMPADVVYENDNLIVIKDIKPEMKTHLLIIPKEEIPTPNDLEENHKDLLFEMFQTAKIVATDL